MPPLTPLDDDESQALIVLKPLEHVAERYSNMAYKPKCILAGGIIASLLLFAFFPDFFVVVLISCCLICCLQMQREAQYLNQPLRVKAVEFHSEKPWIVMTSYSGFVAVWKMDESRGFRYPVSSNLPARACCLIEKKDWVVIGVDSGRICVFSLDGNKIADFEAHSDYIRSLVVHPNGSYLLSCSDDMTVKCWDMEYNYNCVRTFEGHHRHYIMQVKVDPKDNNKFASASLDRTIKFWLLDDHSSTPLFTLNGHESGVNTIDFSTGDKPFLASGADDKTVIVWNYHTRQPLHILEGHSHNVCAVLFHPNLPILVSTSEDCTVRFWDIYSKNENKEIKYLDYQGKGRGWALAGTSNKIAVGLDSGCICIVLAQEGEVVEVVQEFDVSEKILDQEQTPVSTFAAPTFDVP